MNQYHISGVPITDNNILVGIITNRDVRFESDYDQPISNIMSKDNLVTAPEGISLEEAHDILKKSKYEKMRSPKISKNAAEKIIFSYLSSFR